MIKKGLLLYTMKKYEHGGRIYDKNVCLDYSANMNPFGMPKGVKEAIINGMDQYHLYPDDDVIALRSEIAKAEKVDEDFIICGNGASDLIYRLCYSLKPRKACVLAPTFSEYEKALRSAGSEVSYLRLKEENQFRFKEELLENLTRETDVFFLCNPNNPVGAVLKREDLEVIMNHCIKQDIFLVVDECFLDFMEQHEAFSAKSFLENESIARKLFILKAFTKLYGMAGIRLGYGISKDKELMDAMKFHGPAWSVSAPAQRAGIAALKETEYVMNTRKTIETEREYLNKELQRLGYKVYPSNVNYLLFQAPAGLNKHCLEHGILIRSCENYEGLTKEHYRIAVRLREENETLIQCMSRFQT